MVAVTVELEPRRTLEQAGPAHVTAPVPEPEIYAMMGVGLGSLGWMGRRKKLKAAALNSQSAL